MKSKTLLSIIFSLTFATGTMAQTEKGTIMAGGNISLNMTNNDIKSGSGSFEDVGSNFRFGLNPNVGYFLADGFVTGLGVNLATSTNKREGSDDKSTFNSFSVSPFARYYINNGFFGLASVQFGTAKSSFDLGSGVEQDQESDLFGWQVGAGYAIFLNNHVAIEPILSYNSSTLTYDTGFGDSKSRTSGLVFNLGFNIFLGK